MWVITSQKSAIAMYSNKEEAMQAYEYLRVCGHIVILEKI